MTIDDLARITHTPRHVGRLPIGAVVCVYDGETYRNVTSFYTQDERFVLVVEDDADPRETCDRCGTIRVTTFRPDGGIARRRYVFPSDYRTSEMCRTNGHTFPAGDTILR